MRVKTFNFNKFSCWVGSEILYSPPLRVAKQCRKSKTTLFIDDYPLLYFYILYSSLFTSKNGKINRQTNRNKLCHSINDKQIIQHFVCISKIWRNTITIGRNYFPLWWRKGSVWRHVVNKDVNGDVIGCCCCDSCSISSHYREWWAGSARRAPRR